MLLSGTYVTWMHEEIIAEYDAKDTSRKLGFLLTTG